MLLPGPQKPMSLPEGLALQKDPLKFILQATQQYGDFVHYKIMLWDVFLLNHPDHIQHIMRDNWQNYGRKTFQFNNFRLVTGAGLLTTDGEMWLKHRRLLQPLFHKQKLGEMARRMTAPIGRLLERWRPLAEQKAVIKLDWEMLHVALDVVGQALFGVDLSATAGNMSLELLEMMEYVVYRAQNLLAPPQFVPTARNRHFTARLKKFDQWIYERIRERRTRPGANDDLLEMLVHTQFEDGGRLTDQEIRDECFTALIAGYETVASGMTWTLYLLNTHSHIRAQVEQEVDQITAGQLPTFEQANQLRYLLQAFQEALRLYPPSWILSRQSLQPDTIAGYTIPAKSQMVVSPYAIHRHPTFWPEPEKFDPGRFEPELEKQRSPFAYIPFGGGPHLCIGKSLALLEAQLTLGAVMAHFRLEPIEPAVPEPQVTIRPKDGLPMRLLLR